MIVPGAAQLLPRYAGVNIGYRVLTTSRASHTSFTRAGVVEVLPAYFVVRGGVSVPDAGGFIAWGAGMGDTIIEETIQPAAPDYTGPVRDDFAERFYQMEEAFAMWSEQLRGHVSSEVQKALSALAELKNVRDAVNQSKVELIDAMRADLSEISEKLSPQNAHLQYMAELVSRLEESQAGELDLDNRLTSVLRNIGNIQLAIGETDNRIAELGQQVARLEESDGAAVDHRQADTLRILNEAMELLS